MPYYDAFGQYGMVQLKGLDPDTTYQVCEHFNGELRGKIREFKTTSEQTARVRIVHNYVSWLIIIGAVNCPALSGK